MDKWCRIHGLRLWLTPLTKAESILKPSGFRGWLVAHFSKYRGHGQNEQRHQTSK
ncbi:hypothetical protein [Aliikangiella coralliicola]|uniref:hypothetical protein n=1 Tax=Aliikangiella coralliicola TaxID=2592383 RepID=UPI00143D67F4|nr:hypothetical protein [Aliikangiella coralliicola]